MPRRRGKRRCGGTVYAAVSKTAPGNGLWVRIPPPAPAKRQRSALVRGSLKHEHTAVVNRSDVLQGPVPDDPRRDAPSLAGPDQRNGAAIMPESPVANSTSAPTPE